MTKQTCEYAWLTDGDFEGIAMAQDNQVLHVCKNDEEEHAVSRQHDCECGAWILRIDA